MASNGETLMMMFRRNMGEAGGPTLIWNPEG